MEDMMEKNTIGSFLAQLRKANGMTQQELADILNVSNKTVSKWERDESYPDITLIPVIADLFHVTADEILRAKKFSHNEEYIKKYSNIDYRNKNKEKDNKREENNLVEDRQTEYKKIEGKHIEVTLIDYEKNDGEDSSVSNFASIKDSKNIDTDKQVRRMLNKSMTKFKNISYVAMGLTLLGLVSLFTVSFAIYRQGLAFGILLIMIVASIMLMFININNLNSSLEEAEILTDKKELTETLKIARNKYSYISFIGNAIAFIFALPFILSEKLIFRYAIIFKGYLSRFPILYILLYIIYKLAKIIGLPNKKLSNKELKHMNIIQAAAFIFGYAMLVLTVGWRARQAPGKITALASILPFAIIFISTIVYIFKSTSLYERFIIFLAAARNFLFGYIGFDLVLSFINSKSVTKIVLAESGFDTISMWAVITVTLLYEFCMDNYMKKGQLAIQEKQQPDKPF